MTEREYKASIITDWERSHYQIEPNHKYKMANEMTDKQIHAKLAELAEWQKMSGVYKPDETSI